MAGRDSSFGIAIHCGLDGQGIESRYGRDFPGAEEIFRTLPDRPWCPPRILHNV